ncbi:MAG TPA: hypothetical protein PLU30_12400 [Verrucomicrobiae bacterium]|nr:hypothetical protein [Verrucomicrobiae bacterium]
MPGAPTPMPQWIGASAAPAPGQNTIFARGFELGGTARKALVRLDSDDRYRLAINGHAISVGDTPWDAETYDITRLLVQGTNTLLVTAGSDTPRPANCWVWMRRWLAAPGHFTRLSFKTRGARADEWLYVEVVDARGHTSGFYCPERKRRDLLLGHGGAAVEHVIELGKEPTLAHRQQSGDQAGCDFTQIASVGIRIDRKNVLEKPAGQVEFAAIRLQGATESDIGEVAGWRIEPGTGEWRRSKLERGDDGYFTLRYDFTPADDPLIALDLRAWGAEGELARVMSGPGWRANGAPVRVAKSPLDSVSWTRLAIDGPEETPVQPLAAGLSCDFGAERGVEGQGRAVRVNVWAAEPMHEARIQVRVENWAGAEVFRQESAVSWDGAVGHAEFRVPGLARGLYRFDASLPGVPTQRRHAALAVLAPGQTGVMDVFDTLTPIAKGGPLRGIDLNWKDSPALMLGIRDQGVNFLQVHLNPAQLDNGELAELLAFCKATGLHFALNNEHANWVANAPDPSGRNRFDAPGGCHRWDIEPAALDAATATGLFEGVVYDEGEHMQLCRNKYARLPDDVHRKPYLVETTGMTLPAAHDTFVAAARQVRAYHRQHGTRMIVESVFPALWHPLAQAGVTLCPKLLKEDIYPVVLALALGAARQYNAELWFTPDFWAWDHFPGHPLKNYVAALRLAHAVGVDNIYTEFVHGLFRVRGNTYESTDYGAALQAHIREYLPAHPRGYDYRDYEPEVAIIRFPDSDWGQASCYYWKTLYGAEDLPPTPETGEWMQVFSLLTAGKTDPRAVNANSSVYPRYQSPAMIPAPPTAVYDHLAGPDLLRSVGTIFLCGVTISEPTLAAVRGRVNEGAVCFAPSRLCPERVRRQAKALPARITDGQGSWIVLAGFRPEDVGPYRSLVPAAGTTLRLKFKGQVVPLSE